MPTIRNVYIADAAGRDLAIIWRWLSQPGAGRAAARKRSNLDRALADLGISPCRWPYRDHRGRRQRIVEGYTIVYRVEVDTGNNDTAGDVVVIRVFGPGQLTDLR